MLSRSGIRTVPWLAAVLCFATVVWAAKEYVAPPLQNASVFPARDEHPQERVVVAADPYDTREKERIFTLPYSEKGLLPVYLVISNNGDQPVSLMDMNVELVTTGRDKIAPADEDDLYRRFSKVSTRPGQPSRVPIPLPRRAPRGSISAEGLDEIKRAPFQARAVEPGATQAGFVFLDVTDIREPLAGARLYVSGLRNGEGKELMFFEIAMDKYLAAPRTTSR